MPRAAAVGPAIRRGATAAVAVLLIAAVATARGQEAAALRPAWQCLPEETVALVRVPGGRAAADAIVARTKLGATLFSAEMVRRRTAAWESIVAENPAEGKFWRTLREYGLDADDHTHVFDGEAGLALVAPGGDGGPTVMALEWIEPGDAVAERMLAGLGRGLAEMVEEEAAAGNTARRTDVDMAGRPVIWVRLPWRPVEPPGEEAAAKEPFTGVLHLLVARLGGRLAGAAAVASHGALRLNVEMADGGPRVAVDGKPARAAGNDAADAATALARAEETVGRVFERFLAAHDAAAAPAAAVVALVERDGREPGTVPAIEAIVRPLGFGAAAGDSPINRPLVPFGLDTVGPLVWRQWLDGTTWRSEIELSLPGPRHGLMRLLDERADASEVPPFVTREPVGFHRVSLDLGRAYALLREAVLDGEEPPPGSLFGALETQSLALLGADFPTVLSALGTKHTVVWYPMQIDKIVERVRRTAEDPKAAAPGSPDENPLAIVWELADEAPFRKLMQLAAAGGGELRDEQGFRIMRLPGVAVALGQKHLVVAVGEGVAEKTLAAIRTPPAADTALTDSPAHRRAAALVAAEPGGLYGVSDHARGGGMIGSMLAIAAGLARPGADRPGAEGKGAALLASLLPSAAEIEGMLGASVVLWKSDGQGIVLRSATELPPP